MYHYSLGLIKEQYIEHLHDTDEVICYIILTHYNTYYTGITNNIIRRWKEHISGKSSYLSKWTGKEVVHIEWFENRKLAAKKERYIKKVGAKKYLLMLKYKANFGKFKPLTSR